MPILWISDSFLYYKYKLRYKQKFKTKFFLEHPVCIFQIETLRLMYYWFNRFCVGWSRLFSDHNNEGGGNTDMLPCILARKPVVRTLRAAARPGKIRTFNWPAVWCAGVTISTILACRCYAFLYDVFALNNLWGLSGLRICHPRN